MSDKDVRQEEYEDELKPDFWDWHTADRNEVRGIEHESTIKMRELKNKKWQLKKKIEREKAKVRRLEMKIKKENQKGVE